MLWASPASAQFGWEPADLINQPAANLVHQDDRYLTEVAKQTRDISTEDVRLRFRLPTKTGDSAGLRLTLLRTEEKTARSTALSR